MQPNEKYDRLDCDGKWKSILRHFLADDFLTGKHTACPMCGGTDRFRFDDKDGKGTWICNQCGAGDGFKLLMLARKIEFIDAVKLIRPLIDGCDVQPSKPAMSDEKRIELLRALWKRSVPGVDAYLKSRCINTRSNALRYVPEDDCMIALVSDHEGKPATLHRTFISKKEKKLMPGEFPKGGAIRLFANFVKILGIAEGIETAMSASQLFNVPVWSAVNAGGLEVWTPPSGVERVLIFGDCDASFTGQKAAYMLANRLKIRNRLQVEVKIPAETDKDWNDVLCEKSLGNTN